MESHDVESHDVESHDMESHDVESHDVESHDVESHGGGKRMRDRSHTMWNLRFVLEIFSVML